MYNFENLKFAPKSEEHSEAIQEKLFSLGYSWIINNKKVIHKDAKYLYVYQDGDVRYDNSSDIERFLLSESEDLTETFVPLKLKLDGTTSYLEGVDIPKGAEVAVTPLRYKDKIWFFKDNGNTYHNGIEWHECGEHYLYQDPNDKVIWQRDTPRLSDKVSIDKDQLSKIGVETLKRYAEVKPSDVDSNEYIRIAPCDVVSDSATSSLRKDLYRELKLTFFQKFLSGINIQYRVGKGVGSDKAQWHNLTWESLKDMKHDVIEFREKPKHVSVDGIVFEKEESLLKYVRKNFDLK